MERLKVLARQPGLVVHLGPLTAYLYHAVVASSPQSQRYVKSAGILDVWKVAATVGVALRASPGRQ